MHVSLDWAEEFHKPFYYGGAMSVSITTPIESEGNLSSCLKERAPLERTTRTKIVPSDSNTMSNLGLASIITDFVSVHGAWSEFYNRFPDRTNMTFEETDGELDRSHESGSTQRMIAPCIVRIGMGCKDTNRESLCGLLVPKKGSCSTFCPRCSCLE